MSIQAIGNTQDQAMHRVKQPGVRGKSGMASDLKETVMAKVAAGDAERAQPSEERGTGVVGLLQEGHFKGVAEIRLRINFFEQLQSATTQETGEVLETGIQGIETDLDTRVQGLGEEFQFTDQVEDLMNAFEEDMDGLLSGIEDGSFDSSAILAGVRDAFADLFGALQQFEPALTEEPADDGAEAAAPEMGGVVAGGTSEAEITAPAAAEEPAVADIAAPVAEVEASTEPTVFSLALQSLQEWFEAEMESLVTTLSDVRSPPSLSEPSGKGVAYSRFLEMYNEMLGATGGDNDETAASPSPGIETEA